MAGTTLVVCKVRSIFKFRLMIQLIRIVGNMELEKCSEDLSMLQILIELGNKYMKRILFLFLDVQNINCAARSTLNKV